MGRQRKLNTFTRFIKEFFYITVYVEEKGFSQPNTRKFWATVFSAIAATGFILKFTGSVHIDNTTLTILSSLASAAIGWYTVQKLAIDKNPNLDAGTVPDIIRSKVNNILNRKNKKIENKKTEEEIKEEEFN